MVYPRIPQIVGNVISTATALDNKVARFDSTSGQIIQGSYVTIDDNGAISTPVGYGLGIGVTPSYLLHIKGTESNEHPAYSAEFLDADNWTSADWTGSWAAGWDHTPGNTTVLSHDHAAVNATKYQIAYTVTGRTAGTFTITFGGQTSDAISATGAWGPTSTGTGFLQVTPTSDFDGAIIISIVSLTAVSTPAAVWLASGGSTIMENRISSISTNLFFGYRSGGYNTTGSYNTSLGRDALRYNTTGVYNTAIGTNALFSNITGNMNVGLGIDTLFNNTTGGNNVGVGSGALYLNVTSSNSCAVGVNSLYNNTGYQNTAIGSSSGRTITTGYLNSFIGYYSGYNANQLNSAVNSIGLGANTFTNRSNQVVIGDASVVETQLRTGVYIGSTSTTAHTQPTARLHIAAGTASANTAPIKLTAGTLNSATEDGAFEYDGTNLYFSIGATRRTITVT